MVCKHKQGEVENIGPYTWKIIKENIKPQTSMFDIEKQKAGALKKEIEKQRRQNLEIDYQKFKLEKIEAKQDKKIGQKMFIRLGIEKELLKLADVPSFEEWQEQMEHNFQVRRAELLLCAPCLAHKFEPLQNLQPLRKHAASLVIQIDNKPKVVPPKKFMGWNVHEDKLF